MSNTVKPNDLLALALVWGLVVIGCLIGDVKPQNSADLTGCASALDKTTTGPRGG